MAALGGLSLRAATDATIRAEGDRSYRCGDGRTIVVRAGTERLRTTEDGVELLVAPEAVDSDTVLLEVELVW